jgi:Amt family ammonium transporter
MFTALAAAPKLSPGDTSWLLCSTALVLLMTPGLALFYGGMNRSKSVLNMFMMSFSCIGLISVLWIVYGFSFSFGTNGSSGTNRFIGSFQYLATKNFATELWGTTGIPTYVVLAFQMMFAIITVALISGSISDRAKFSGWLVFAFGWFTIVYVPVAHWIWGGGFINTKLHALDFAGGTAVHINAGSAAFALAIVLGKRVGWPKETFKPHNVPMVALGAGLLWFGWFGFNAGSEFTADGTTAIAFVNTQDATAAALLGWIIVEWIRSGKPTMIGASSGAVAGLVAITPSCAYISPLGAVGLGLIAGAICALAVSLKYRFAVDDSLDVFGVHALGGISGALLTGIFNAPSLGGPGSVQDWVTMTMGYPGIAAQLFIQAKAVGLTIAWTAIVAFVAFKIADLLVGLRVSHDEEREGLDISAHGESAYDY